MGAPPEELDDDELDELDGLGAPEDEELELDDELEELEEPEGAPDEFEDELDELDVESGSVPELPPPQPYNVAVTVIAKRSLRI